MFVDITCDLTNGHYVLAVEQARDKVHTDIYTPRGHWHEEDSLTNSDNAVREAISAYAGKLRKSRAIVNDNPFWPRHNRMTHHSFNIL